MANSQSFAGSGASIRINEDSVCKGTSYRIERQGHYIQNLSSKGLHSRLPKINHIGDAYYEMERLNEIDWSVESPSRILEETFYVLKDEFWPNYVESDKFFKEVAPWELHQFLHTMGADELIEAYNRLPIRLLFNFDTAIHGDPTLANCMLRDTELVLIDPLPPEGKIPAAEYVDRGKLLQSYFGYERIIRPGFPEVHPDLYSIIMQGMDDEEQQMCLFFCALHFLRILPYRNDQPEIKQAIQSKFKEVTALMKF